MKIPSLLKIRYNKGKRETLLELSKAAQWIQYYSYFTFLNIEGLEVFVTMGVVHKKLSIKDNEEAPNGWLREVGLYNKSKPNKTSGWYPISQQPEDKYHIEAHINWLKTKNSSIPDGYYKLIGPKINNNTYKLNHHYFVNPYSHILDFTFKTGGCNIFYNLNDYMKLHNIPSIIFVNCKDAEGNQSVNMIRQAKINIEDFNNIVTLPF